MARVTGVEISHNILILQGVSEGLISKCIPFCIQFVSHFESPEVRALATASNSCLAQNTRNQEIDLGIHDADNLRFLALLGRPLGAKLLQSIAPYVLGAGNSLMVWLVLCQMAGQIPADLVNHRRGFYRGNPHRCTRALEVLSA